MQLPRRVEDLDPAWMTAALRSSGALADARVVEIRPTVIGDGKGFLSAVARVALEYDRVVPGAPPSVVVKLEPTTDDFRSFGEELHAFEREVRFYREVAAAAPIRLARLYFADFVAPDWVMVLEDLSFATPGDQVAGMHADLVVTAARQIARLQARYWHNEALAALDWMPESNAVADDYAACWPGFVRKQAAALTEDDLALGERLCGAMPWVEGEIARRPRTIVHADLRADNLLFGPRGTDSEVLIIDWQVAIRSLGAFDVARLMGGSEIPAERRGHHLEVVRAWWDTLVAGGVADYAWEDAVRDVRLGALAALAYPVHFSNNAGELTGRAAEVVRVMARRLFDSAVELDAASILP